MSIIVYFVGSVYRFIFGNRNGWKFESVFVHLQKFFFVCAMTQGGDNQDEKSLIYLCHEPVFHALIGNCVWWGVFVVVARAGFAAHESGG